MSADMLANLSPMGKFVRPTDIGGIGGAPGGVGCERILLLGLLWYCGGGTTERDIKGLVTCLLLLDVLFCMLLFQVLWLAGQTTF